MKGGHGLKSIWDAFHHHLIRPIKGLATIGILYMESELINQRLIKQPLHVQKIYYSLQQQKVKSVEHVTTITELVVVWSVCSTCTCTVNQRFLWPQLLM